MKQLLLMRHAEAQSKRPGLRDFDRSLTGLGRTEALDAAECLKRAAFRLDVFLVSPAVRARETALIVAAQLDFNSELLYDPLLYGEDMQALLQPLQRYEPQIAAVLMVGHNPGLSALAGHLAHSLPVTREPISAINGDAPPARAGHELPLELATAGICRVQFEAASWSGLQPAAVTAVSLLR